MDKRLTIIRQKDEAERNRILWHSMTPEERLKIADELREEYARTFLKEDEQGFKRVFNSFKRK